MLEEPYLLALKVEVEVEVGWDVGRELDKELTWGAETERVLVEAEDELLERFPRRALWASRWPIVVPVGRGSIGVITMAVDVGRRGCVKTDALDVGCDGAALDGTRIMLDGCMLMSLVKLGVG